MNKLILYLITMSFALSCDTNKKLNKTGKAIGLIDTLAHKTKDGIRFDFRAGPANTATATFVIHATLYNDHTDTACFLSSTCEGEQYSLHYDTSQFELTPRIICNVSLPKIIKIAPKEQHNFDATFRIKNEATHIKLGFDLYTVDRLFTPENTKTINIFNRPKEEQNIIWADKKHLQ